MPHAAAVCSHTFASVLSAGDLEGAAACFARDGCLVTPDGTAVHGRDRIRSVLAQMVVNRTEIEVELSSSISSGEVMLVRERWRVRSGENGGQLEQTLHPTLVLRQIEAAWKLSIAAPWLR
ncbi:MAG TPA: nuclear transport factor 2 family protein [Solirubrobacterales bacterium]|nr:nuclear transport factor 2 family protein [Solirubrobacterales bacterium]